MEVSVLQFCQTVAETYHLDEKDIYALWKKSQSSSRTVHPVMTLSSSTTSISKRGGKKDSSSTTTKKKRKKSAYTYFSDEMRRRFLKEDPSLGFGELSRRISQEWKRLSTEEKKVYDREDTTSLSSSLKTVGDEDEREEELSSTEVPPVSPLIEGMSTPPESEEKETEKEKHSPIFEDGSTLPLLEVDLFRQVRASPDTVGREASMRREDPERDIGGSRTSVPSSSLVLEVEVAPKKRTSVKKKKSQKKTTDNEEGV